MSGNTILKDGRSVNENYGTDLDKLEEEDRVGVVRTSNGDLVFYVNGVRKVFILKLVQHGLLISHSFEIQD